MDTTQEPKDTPSDVQQATSAMATISLRPSVSIFDIPLITDLISTHISIYDLVECVRVCHRWHDIFLPHLWNHIYLDDNELVCNVEILFPSPEIKTALLRNAHLIRKVTTANRFLWKRLQRARCYNIQEIVTRTPEERNHAPRIHCDTMIAIMDMNRGLKSMVMHDLEPESNDVWEQFIKALSRLDQLRTLKLDWDRTHLGIFVQILRHIPRSLENLSLRVAGRMPELFAEIVSDGANADDERIQYLHSDDIPIMKDLLQFRDQDYELGLKRIDVERMGGLDYVLLMPLLKRCPSLEHLVFDENDPDLVPQLTDLLQQYCPRLQSLDLSGFHGSLEDLCALIETVRALRSIFLKAADDPGMVLSSLLKHAETLETLDLRECWSMQSKDLVAFINSFPHLTVLKAADPDANYEWDEDVWVPNLKLLMQDFRSIRWDCSRTLTVLSIRIETNASTTNVELEQVYITLGRLTRLKSLTLGCWHDKDQGADKKDAAQGKTLTLRLSQGLAHLAALERLSCFDFSSVEGADVEIDGVRWMAETWRMLEDIVGFGGYEADRKACAEVMSNLREDVKIHGYNPY